MKYFFFSTSLLKMDSTTKIPDRKDFYSTIQEKSISVEEHKFASRMWDLYEIKNLSEYCELYCMIDTSFVITTFVCFLLYNFHAFNKYYTAEN